MTDHAHELRRHARKIAHPAGDVPAVMLAAADEIERLQSVIAGLRAAFETAHARIAGLGGLTVCFDDESEWRYGYIQAAIDLADCIRARGDA
jgi:hypothetical protein